MTARFSEASDRVSYTATAPPAPSAGLTFACWIRLGTDRNDLSTILRLFGASTTMTLATKADGVTPALISVGNTDGIAAPASLTVGDWYRLAVTVSGTTGTVYLASGDTGPVLSASGTVSGGSATPTGLAIGGRAPADATEFFLGDLAYARIWASVLTQAQLVDNWKTATPQTPGAWADWPLTADLADDSGAGHDLAAGTTPVEFLTGDEPPLGGNTAPRITAFIASTDGAVATATATVEDDQGLTGAAYVFEWGDGQTTTTASPSATHTYAASGTYPVLVTVTDSGGLMDSAAAVATPYVPAATYHANSPLVAMTWLRTISSLAGQVAAELPAGDWTTFVTVPGSVGGTTGVYIRERFPVVTVHAWARNSGTSKKVPRGRALSLLEDAVNATWADRPVLVLPGAFRPVWLEYVKCVLEPQEVPEPDTNYAHYVADFAFGWIER